MNTHSRLPYFNNHLSNISFQTIFQQAPVSTQIFSPDGLTIMVNKAWEELWQTKAKDLIGRYNILKDTQLEQKKIMSLVKKAFRGEMVRLPPIRYEPNKTIFGLSKVDYLWVGGIMYPLIDKEGNINQVVLQHMDMTRSVEMEKMLAENERKYRSLIEKGQDVIGLLNNKRRLEYITPSVTNVLGYTPEEMLQMRNPFRLIHPFEFPKILKLYKDLLLHREGEVRQILRVMHKNGTYVWIEAIGINYLHDETIRSVVINFRDITFQKKNEEREALMNNISSVLGSSIDFETTIKNVGELIVPTLADYSRIVLVEDDGLMKEVNVHHTKVSKIGLVQKLYEGYKGNADYQYGVEHIISTGEPEIMEQVVPDAIAKKYKTPKTLQNTLVKLGLRSYMGVPLKIRGKVIGAITFSSTKSDRIYSKEDLRFAIEISFRIAHAIENARLYKDAQKAIALRDDFISLASHELKTPITSLKLYTQIMRSQYEKGRKKDFSIPLVKMNELVNRLTMLINDLLNISKIQHGKLEYDMGKVDINELTADIVASVEESDSKHTIIVNGEIKKKIFADRYRIYQVMTNLLSNAAKYSPHSAKIMVKLTSGKHQAYISVTDFGIGIEQEHIPHIFDPFYRVTNPAEKTFPGLGMGLYITREIIKRHKGEIDVESEKGKGSTFRFSLPYA